MYYQIIKAGKEHIGIVWRYVANKPLIENIFLPCPRRQLISKIKSKHAGINLTREMIPDGVAEKIAQIYSAAEISFDYSFLNWAKLTKFSVRVLKQTCKIPPGKVDTYSGLAVKIGSPRAARAVGTALANNPFPLVIPCHRVVRADGSLGGFGGGIGMKKELLNKEGVASDGQNRVTEECFFSGVIKK